MTITSATASAAATMTPADLPRFALQPLLQGDDPFTALNALRDQAPIWQSEYGVHVLTYEGCVELLRDDRLHRGVVGMLDGAGITDEAVRQQWLVSLLGSPKPDHDRMRRLMSSSFTPRALAGLRTYVGELTERAVQAATGRGTLDVMADLAVAIPPAIFCRMIGAPDQDAPFVGRASAQILEIFSRRPELASSIESATHELMDYVLRFVEDRRRSPRSGDDLIAGLLSAEEAGERLTTDELVALVIEVLEASTDNTSSQLALVLHAAAQDPDRWAALRADASRIPAFVEEAMRLWPRIITISKAADTPITFAGVDIPAGMSVFATVPSALRDPSVFGDAEAFDATREKALNLNFGYGGHYCIGANLARLEICGALEVLTRRWATIRPAGPLELDANIGVVTVRSMPLAFEPAYQGMTPASSK